MIYLLAKYTLLFLLAAALGAILGYWWSRRNFVDVSESYEELRKAAERSDEQNWSRLWECLDAIPEAKETDLSQVYDRLDLVSNVLANIPRPEPVSLNSVEDGLDALRKQVAGIPVPQKPKEPDLNPLIERIEKLERSVAAIPAPADLGPIVKGLGDLAPVARQIGLLEQRIAEIPVPESVDLKPVDRRLRAMETEISRLTQRLSKPDTGARRAVPARADKRKGDEPRILSAALYGKKDDLKRISGVGPKLERLLNKNGVFYFWQVASWSRNDIVVIDERLDAFKGRISRDNWVSQARRLQRTPGAARMPAG